MAKSSTTLINTCPSRLAKTTSDESIREICSFFILEGAVPIVDKQEDTILHFISIYGNVRVLEALVGEGLLSSEDYLKKNVKGDTALHEAARFGQVDVARILVREERRLVWECNDKGETLVFVAAECGQEEVFELLKEHQSGCRQKSNDGRTILHAAISRQHYYLALKILETYPDLAHDQDDDGVTALHLLAMTPKSFRSCSRFMLRKLGTEFRMPLHILELIIYHLVPAMYMQRKHNIVDVEDPRNDNVIITRIKRSSFVKKLFSLRWLKDIDGAKQSHILALALPRRLIQGDKKVLEKVLIEAARNGVYELATEILSAWPDAALNSYDEHGRNILLIAVESKQKYFYEHLKTVLVDQKKRLTAEKDRYENTILHLAAHVCDEIPNNEVSFMPILHILWDVSWFQRVCRDLDPQLTHLKNSENKTAEEVFKEAHGKLRDKTEELMRTCIQGPMVVAALIATVNIAAMFTIPSGFHQENGNPVLYGTNKRGDLRIFMYYLWITFVCATLSCGNLAMLNILPYHFNDFYFTVPVLILMAGTGLFYSICMSIMTILQAYILEDSMENTHWYSTVFGLGLACFFYVDSLYAITSHLIENIANTLL